MRVLCVKESKEHNHMGIFGVVGVTYPATGSFKFDSLQITINGGQVEVFASRFKKVSFKNYAKEALKFSR